MAPSSVPSLISSVDKLKLTQDAEVPLKSKQPEPADSWEEEAEAEDETLESIEVDSGTATPVGPISSADYPGAPPPTPSSPDCGSGKNAQGFPFQTFTPYGLDGAFRRAHSSEESSPTSRGVDDRRPDKTTAVASRLIAAGIGQKTPKRTKEQREYDQAMKVQEKKKREQAKAGEERKKMEKERARKAVWDD